MSLMKNKFINDLFSFVAFFLLMVTIVNADARTYKDTIVRLSNNPDFVTGVITYLTAILIFYVPSYTQQYYS